MAYELTFANATTILLPAMNSELFRVGNCTFASEYAPSIERGVLIQILDDEVRVLLDPETIPDYEEATSPSADNIFAKAEHSKEENIRRLNGKMFDTSMLEAIPTSSLSTVELAMELATLDADPDNLLRCMMMSNVSAETFLIFAKEHPNALRQVIKMSKEYTEGIRDVIYSML